MEIVNSSLKFGGYEVNTISFKRNEKFIPTKNTQLTLRPSIERKISKDDENHYRVCLKFEIRTLPDQEMPFSLKIALTGFFTLEGDNYSLISENSLAILFPYLRALISTITANANIPPIILPIVNISEMLKKKNENWIIYTE